MSHVHLGLSGYSYREWQGGGLFYPPTIKQREYLGYYSSRFNALEGVGTWRTMPTEKGVAKWIEETPVGFAVSPKMHQKVTHFTRLKPEGLETLNAFVKLIEPLEKAGKLGPILLQLPPNLKRDDALLETFLAAIPHRPTLRWAVEFRNESWHAPEVEALLRAKNVAWVAVETEDADAQLRDTADHIYIRLRKDDYPDSALKVWADYVRAKADAGRDCFLFCKHQDAEAPWLWADRLTELARSS